LLHKNALFPSALWFYKYSIYLNKIIGADINNIYAYINTGYILKILKKKNYKYYLYKGANLQPQSELAKKTLQQIKTDGKIKIDKEFKQIIELSQLAEKNFKEKNFKKAIEYYKKILTLQPKSYKTLSNIGDCYFYLKNYTTAIKYYKKAIRIKKDYANAYYNLGGCYIMLKNLKEAKKIWEKGLEFNPQSIKLKKALQTYFK